MNSPLFGAKSTASAFPSFGAAATTQSTSLFGTNKPTSQFNFTPTTTSTTSSVFASPTQKTGLFGTPSTASFGTPVSAPFGTTASAPFGTPANTPFGSTSTPSAFGGTATSQLFGSNTSATPFGNNANATTFGNNTAIQPFGTTNTGFGSLNTTAFGNQTINNQANISEDDLFIESISQPSLCGDERDVIISRWNQLQAMWGYGTGLSCKGKAIYNADNYLARFKSVSYNQVPNCDDSEGFVSLLIKRPFTAVLDEKIQIHEKLHKIINNTAITISIVDVRPAIKAFSSPIVSTQPKPNFGFQPATVMQPSQLSTNTSNDSLCDVFIKVTETMPNVVPRLVPSSMLATFLKAEPLKSRLESELSVIDIVPQLSPNSKEISDYLNGPAPRGLDVELWEKVKQQCPNPNTLVPVPVIGMSELKARISGQVEFAQSQLNTIRREADTVSEMKTKVVTMSGKADQLKRKERELSNRILKVMCRLEIIKKQGYSLSGDEEALKCSLDRLWNQMVGPYGVKSRLQEIVSKPTGPTGSSVGKLSYNQLNSDTLDELKEYFGERQQSIKEMMTLIRENIACLNVIENTIL